MSDEATCCVCGQPLALHSIELRYGVAHTAVRDSDHHVVSLCSSADSDRNYTLGEIARLRTIVRSLRYMAGRLRTKGLGERAAALTDYSFKMETERDRLIGKLSDWFPWKGQNEP